MAKIHPLPDAVISKIAAGEVIERPGYALKELIENALDAYPSTIEIEIEQSGLRKILVKDDGEGMTPQDLKLAVKPHTTSKIRQLEDLLSLNTLGFRGEALSTIAAISHLIIQSRALDNHLGYELEIERGRIIRENPVGMNVGTIVTALDLFGNVPARKKFLRSPQTEYRHLLEVVIQAALSFPQVRFRFTHNSRLIFDLLKDQTLEQRIQLLFGKETWLQLLPVEFKMSQLQVYGYISRPQLYTLNVQKNYLFVNHRRIEHKLLNSVIKEAYGRLLDQVTYPFFILFLKIPPQHIDVNVHPRKELVNFLNLQLVQEALHKAITQTLNKHNLTYFNPSWHLRSGLFSTYGAATLKDEVLEEPTEPTEWLTTDKVIQIHQTYLITSTAKGLIIIDQHAAHERVLYEQLVEAYQLKNIRQFPLPQAQLLELSLVEYQLLTENLETFKKLGFDIEPFIGHSAKINAVPWLLQDRDQKQIIQELLDELAQEKTIKNIDHRTNLMLSSLACRAAIKAGEKLTQDEAKKLLGQLNQTKSSYTCPHGRPVFIEFSLSQLHKLFRRSR